MLAAMLIAFIGGALTILMPCGPMLLPSFFAWSFTSPTAMAKRTGQFTLGLLAGTVPMGIVVGGLGVWLRGYVGLLTTVAAVLIIALAMMQFFGWSVRLPARRTKATVGVVGAQVTGSGGAVRAQVAGGVNDSPGAKGSVSGSLRAPIKRDSSSALGVMVLGFSYSLAAIGCSGPILGTVLSVSTVFSSGGVLSGVLAMVFYALGMAFPVVILAFLWDRFDLGNARWLKPTPAKVLGQWTTRGNIISGSIMAILGVFLLIFGRTSAMPSVISVNQQVDLEKRIMDWVQTVPWSTVGIVVIGGLVAVALSVVAMRMLAPSVKVDERQS